MIKQQERTAWEDAGKSADRIAKLIGNTTVDIIHEIGNTGKAVDDTDMPVDIGHEIGNTGKAVADTTVNIVHEVGRRSKAVVDAGLGKS